MRNQMITAIVASALLASCNLSEHQNAGNVKAQIVEFAPFVLKEGITEKMLLDASNALQKEFVMKQPGFIKRVLVKKSANEYIDIVYWDNRSSADKAMQNAANSPVCASYFQFMEETDHNNPNAGVSHFLVVNEYSN